VRGVRAAALGGESARAEIEARIRERYGAREVVLVDSGTTALRLALSAAEARRPGRPVAMPAYGCFDLVTAAVGAGVPQVFYDVEPSTLQPHAASLDDALAEGPSAVVAVHLYGIPVEMEETSRRARSAGALLVEDAAQGTGGELHGTPLGSFGSLSVLSFGRGKGLTGGGGGALLAHDAEGVETLRSLEGIPDPEVGRPRGWGDLVGAAAQWALGRPGIYGLPASLPFLHLGETRYASPGAVAAASAASLGILSETWERCWEEAAVRRRNARRLLETLDRRSGFSLLEPIGGAVPGYLRLSLLASEAAARVLRGRRARALGIMPGYPLPLPELEAAEPDSAGSRLRYPGAEELVRRLFTFPTHSRLDPASLKRLEALVGGGPSWAGAATHEDHRELK